MPDETEEELSSLERLHRQDTFRNCEKLHRELYDFGFDSPPRRTEALRVLFDKGDRRIKSALRSLDESPYHPLFITGLGGEFIFFNRIARIVFHEFELSTERTAQQLYNDGAIFRERTGEVHLEQIGYKDISEYATKCRKRTPPNRCAFTKGNDLVFFSYSFYKRKLVLPVTATLHVSTLHTKDLGTRRIGTLGVMIIPWALRHIHHTPTRKTAFVVLPFKRTWSKKVAEVIKKTARAAGFEVKMGRYPESPDVIAQIREDIREAELVIADITGENSNVTYEIGFAHADKQKHRQVIVLNQAIPESPFDFRLSSNSHTPRRRKGWRSCERLSLSASKR